MANVADYLSVGVGGGTRSVKARWNLARSTADNLTQPYASPPIPVIEIAEMSNVDVIFADFGENGDRVAGFCDFNNASLYVNKADNPERQNFTIAHELGHWLLHAEIFRNDPERYPVLPRFQAGDRNDPLEKEANHFAAHLLVPTRLLTPVIRAPVSALASIFGVSKTMMEFRVQNVRS